MKGIKALGAAMLALLALGSLSATAASAHTWEIKEQLYQAEPMQASGTLTFSDTNGLGYKCTVYFEGKVGPGAAGEITKVTNKAVEGSKEILCTVLGIGGLLEWQTINVKALGLPWKTEITYVNEELRDRILGPESGWEVLEHREGHLEHKNETLLCRGEVNTLIKNVPSSHGVEATNYAALSPQECTGEFGAESKITMRTTGSELVTSSAGTLSVS